MIDQSAAWKALQAHSKTMDKVRIGDLFAQDNDRFKNFSIDYETILLDYSKNLVSEETISLLCDLARKAGVEEWRDKMLAGEKINHTESRAALHTALRRPKTDIVEVDGENVVPPIHDTLDRMRAISDKFRNGSWKGHNGKPITDVVNIGIGGSDLGPKMVCRALEGIADSDVTVHFVSNVDGYDIQRCLQQCSPETTAFIIASKTFTTQETMANAHTARQWLVDALNSEEAVNAHFLAVSTNIEAANNFGIAEDNIIGFEDWVGGRYSLWSAIGLPICIAAGFENFRALLDGACSMDNHFRQAPLEKNMPVLLAMIGIWHRNFRDYDTQGIMPYCEPLEFLPFWAQQLEMESNGKQIDRDGKKVSYDTVPVIFGATGTNSQHSFFQMLHQGTSPVPCDFIGIAATNHPYKEQHDMLLTNMLAQTQALMDGQKNSIAPHRSFEGNRPSTTILLESLDAFNLGMLLTLYEHKTFVQGVIWNINSFDQWGVTLGKEIAGKLADGNKNEKSQNVSTQGLQGYIAAHGNRNS